MGLQGQLSDVSSESIPILVVATIANCVNYVRSLVLTALHLVGFSRIDFVNEIHEYEGLCGAVGTSLASLIVLSEQLNLNREFSHRYEEEEEEEEGRNGTDCIVCLNRFGDGDRVRKLACSHLFHKNCFDGWLHHLNFNCPLCRTPLVSKERVEFTQKRVTADIITWYSFR